MQSIPPMEERVRRALAHRAALERARQRAQLHASRLASRDSRVASLRLGGTVLLLALLVGVGGRMDPALRVAAGIAFIGFFFLASKAHQRLQARTSRWKAVAQSYAASQARSDRDANALAALASPWHESARSAKAAGHLAASDLDLHSGLFDWLDSCATGAGSRRLLELIYAGADAAPEAIAGAGARNREIRELCATTARLRRLEALRFDERYLVVALKREGGSAGIPAAAVEAGFKRLFLWSVAGAQLVAWLILIPRALSAFAWSAKAEDLIPPASLFLAVLLAGAFAFQPMVNALRAKEADTQWLRELFAAQARGARREASPRAALPALKALERLLSGFSIRQNPVFWIAVHLLFPFDPLLHMASLWSGERVLGNWESWLREATESDALAAFARVAADDPTLDARVAALPAAVPREILLRNAGHPLLPPGKRVCNDLHLLPGQPVVLLTGSNMAGKSTFLRTLGVNAVLRNLGAPVCADEFLMPPARLLCAIRVDDSLAEGTSYFYAEVKRLKSILDALHENPAAALFLVDEIFRGTNNRERLAGSWHLLEAFLGSGALGVVSTHDLALTQLAVQDARLRNMHFREQVRSGALDFDYLLREGPCPTTNALHIMRAAGLPVPADAGETFV